MKRKKLIIMAQPSKKGFLWEIAKTYKSESEKYGDEIEILDLYDKKNFQPNLEFEDMKVLNYLIKGEKELEKKKMKY